MTTTELQAYNYCQETINMKNVMEKSYMVLCSRLHKIKSERLYEANFDSWEVFLEELRINKRSAEAMCKIYEKFVVELGISPDTVAMAGGWTVAETLLPLTTSKELAEEGLEFAKGALRKDVRMFVNDKLGRTPEGLCAHADVYTVIICRTCGEKWQDFKEYDESSHKHADATK